MDEQKTEQQIVKELEDTLEIIGRGLDAMFSDLWGRKGFALFIFELEKPGQTNYISNASRDDMIKALRETLDRFEKQQINPELAPFKQ